MASADQHACEPCSRGETVSTGYSWCSDCEEILCDVCDKSHRVNKLTLSHNLTEIRELPFIPKETVTNFRLCGNHPEKIVDFYCAFHDVVCCQTCIAESHRACQQVKVVDDVSGDIKSSALVEDVSKAVSYLLKTLQSVIENRNNNKELVFLQEPLIKTSIAKLKKDLLQHVESLEKSLLSELSKLKSKAVSQLDTDLAETKSMSESWQKIKQELDFNIEHGSNNQLFCSVQNLKNKISDEEMKLQDNLTRTMNLDLEYFVEEDLYMRHNFITLQSKNCISALRY
ncbi:E3 ubiquitin-protein ligase TRIM45-like [Mytilus trossulus]|uniref:E3 ubiquitin-protein ligase TRIM45-like n=1 Tax=Mytilus trossulus TaxID=6551 RepID=UPI003005BBDF